MSGGPVEVFLRRLAAAPSAVLSLDYDGTLAPFHVRRDEAVPYPGVRPLLAALMAGGRTRVVVISGRGAVEVSGLLGLSPAPEIWGAHGWERWRNGHEVTRHDPGADARMVLARAREALSAHGLDGHAEWKHASVAVHWRGEADAAGLRARATDALSPLTRYGGFALLPFADGLELRCRRWHKGFALRAVLAEEPTEVAVAYAGDDATDEDAFLALPGHGLGIRVSADDRPTAAAVSFPGPAELIAFLGRWQATRAP